MAIRFYLNPDDVLNGVRTPLAADSTLQGSSYLNSSSLRIFTGRVPRTDAANLLLIELNPPATVSMSQTYDYEVRVHAYCDLLSNGQIPSNCNKIVERCEQILNDRILTVTNANCRPMVSLGIIPAYYDESDTLDKAHAVLRLEVRVDPTS